MQALREIIEIKNNEIKFKIPSEIKSKKVELIILPIDNEKTIKKNILENLPKRKYGKVLKNLSREQLYSNEK